MIPVAVQGEPPDFDAVVRIPGQRSLYEKASLPVPAHLTRTHGEPCRPVQVNHQPVSAIDDIPPAALADHWTAAIPMLQSAYASRCMYTCLQIRGADSASVDHFIPKSIDRRAAYDWSNLRLVLLKVNARKGTRQGLLDPFHLQPGTFALDLITGAIRPGPATQSDPALRQQALNTIQWLNLDSIQADRREEIAAYQDGDSLDRISERNCFVGQEIRRQQLPRADGTLPHQPPVRPATLL